MFEEALREKVKEGEGREEKRSLMVSSRGVNQRQEITTLCGG